MLALARAFLHADTSAERVEGLSWALIARDDRSLFWFDDTEAGALIAVYEQAMPEGEIASARRTAALWWSIDYAIWKDYSKDELPNIEASRRMFRELAPMETSPAARFDAGALAYLEGRNHDAFLAWWPLAKRGYCQAQFAAGSLLQWLRPAVPQPLSYQWDGEPFSHDHATTTALAHAAMQGVVYAQVTATFVSRPGVIIVPSLEAAASRWEDRAAAQGELKAVNPFNYRREDGIP
jgi:hypothetical protein